MSRLLTASQSQNKIRNVVRASVSAKGLAKVGGTKLRFVHSADHVTLFSRTSFLEGIGVSLPYHVHEALD